MISPKKFMIKLVRKSQKMEDVNAGNFNKSSVAEKASEEEFGLSSDGPSTLPCDAVFMDKLVSLIQQGVS
ncbi:hypothetical protein Patl1_35763 [Pistacia atlantica]|nr:hypothetical protein Patl1_35763 [Pistacia atlantica]